MKISIDIPKVFLINGDEILTEDKIKEYEAGEYTVRNRFEEITLIDTKDPAKAIEFGRKKLSCQSFADRVILHGNFYNKELKVVEKKVIATLVGTKEELHGLKKYVNKRNDLLWYRAVLACDLNNTDRPSYFSSEYSGPKLSMKGFFNLAVLLMLANNFMLILDNFLKYGFLVFENLSNLTQDMTNVGFYASATGLLVFYILGYYTILFNFKGFLRSGTLRFILQVLLCIALCVYPILMVYLFPGVGFLARVMVSQGALVGVLKLISFFHVVNDVNDFIWEIKKNNLSRDDCFNHFRKSQIEKENYQLIWDHRDSLTDLISLRSVLIFVFMPTLCYQLSYPRTTEIRKFWLFKRIVESVVCHIVLFYIVGQHTLPIMAETLDRYMSDNYIAMTQAILRLAFPNTLCWIIVFFMNFQVNMNIMAELTYFADRQFYLEWWNCKSLAEYWRFWNLPVHHWFIRHCHNPMIKRRVSKRFSSFVIFFISAVAHEYVISFAIGKLCYWAFVAMLAQFFVIEAEKIMFMIFGLGYYSFGNVQFWISFCIVGQPILVFSYYLNYLNLI